MESKFNNWNTLKQDINEKDIKINIKEKNIYFISIGQNIGTESYGKGEQFLRPVIVYKKLGHNYFLGIPLTSKIKDGSYYFTFNIKNGKKNTAMLNQIKTFDAKRVVSYAGKLSNNIYKNLTLKLDEFLNITLIKNEGVPTRAKVNKIVPQNKSNVNSNKILLTGGAGYIGSHTCIELLQNNYDIVVYDNLSNSSVKSLKRVESITSKKVSFIKGDIRDEESLTKALDGCDGVIHFAGLKAVGESVEKPLEYYDNNVQGTLCLLRAMKKTNVKTIVFSSSATVYGDPQYLPLDENHPLSTTNPYGATKLMIEEILRDLYKSDNTYKIAILRYFNPVGSHKSALIGEDPSGIPNNLMPFIAQTAIGKRESLSVFGGDWDTPDGTGVRDYIHVVDLSNAHVKALEFLKQACCEAINIGTGNGYSVLDMVKSYEKASNLKVSYTIQPRRAGDIASCYAKPTKAKELLNWEAKYTIDDMCKDTFNWQDKNPNGYDV